MKMLSNATTVSLLALPLTPTTMARGNSSANHMTGFAWPTPTPKPTLPAMSPVPSANLTTSFYRRAPPPAAIFYNTATTLPSLPNQKPIIITALDAFIIMVSVFGVGVVLCLIIFLRDLRQNHKAKKLQDVEMEELGGGNTWAKNVRKDELTRAPRWWKNVGRKQGRKKAKARRNGTSDGFEERVRAEFVVGTPSELGVGVCDEEGDGDLGTANMKFTY